MSPKIDISIIGAGFVGLAIAVRLTHRRRDVFFLEKVDRFRQETNRHRAVSIGISSSERSMASSSGEKTEVAFGFAGAFATPLGCLARKTMPSLSSSNSAIEE